MTTGQLAVMHEFGYFQGWNKYIAQYRYVQIILLHIHQQFMEFAGIDSDPVAWCEGCGLPFFEDDQYALDENGVPLCPEGGPCLDKPEKANA